MKYTEFIHAIKARRPSTVEDVFDAATDIIYSVLKGGGSIHIKNLFTLRTTIRKARPQHNFGNGQVVDIPEMRKVKVVPSLNFKNAIRNEDN